MTDADWRLTGQERYLAGVSLQRSEWTRPRPDWDHDHCEFCGAEFSDAADGLRVGYTTADNYHWVCPDCFADFRERFGWAAGTGQVRSSLAPVPPQGGGTGETAPPGV